MKPLTTPVRTPDHVLDRVADRILEELITQHDRDRIRAHLARERVKVKGIVEGRKA